MGVGLAFSMTACNVEFKFGKKDDKTVIDNTVKGGDALNEKKFNNGEDNTKNDIEETDTFLYKDGATDYKIVVPAESVNKDTEDMAASELKFFMNDATGIKFEVIDDSEITYKEDGSYDFNSKYISIGDTKIFNQTDIKNDAYNGEKVFTQQFIGLDGFVIKTIGNTVVINAVGNNGKVYGAYGFLERNMDYRFYYKDEWAICKDPQRTVKKMDVIDRPEFESRYLDTATNAGNIIYMMRVRQHGSQGASIAGGMEGGAWKLSDQSLCGELLDFNVYVKGGHGNWYSGDGGYRTGQMCVATVLENQYSYVVKKADYMDTYKFGDGTYAPVTGFIPGEDINLLETASGFVYEKPAQFNYAYETKVIKADTELNGVKLVGNKFTVNGDFTLAKDMTIAFEEGTVCYELTIDGKTSYIPVDYEGFDVEVDENKALLTKVYKTITVDATTKVGETALIGNYFTVNSDFTLTAATAETEGAITFAAGNTCYVLTVGGNTSYIPVDYADFDVAANESLLEFVDYKKITVDATTKVGEVQLSGNNFIVNSDFTLTPAAAEATENFITFNEGDIAYVLNVGGTASYVPVGYEAFKTTDHEELLKSVTPVIRNLNGSYYTHQNSGRIILVDEYNQANFDGVDIRLRPDDIKPLDEMTKNLIGYIVKNPNARVFMLGINDNSTYQCKCEKCTPQVEKIRYSGQMVLLAKALQKNIRAWQNGEELPGVEPVSERDKNRVIKLSFFAYLYTIEAPTTRDDTTGEYTRVPYDYDGDGDYDDLKCDEDIIIRIAPISSVNMHTHYESDYNSQANEAFKSWKEIAENFAVWDYGTTFSDYISPYPDWGVIQDDFYYYRENNVTELLTQLPAHTSGTSFFALMIYLRAQLMWDMDQDVEWLIQDFFKHYYGPEAYDAMWAYFNFLRCYMQAADVKYTSPDGKTELNGFVNEDGATVTYHGYIYEIFTQPKWFPFNTVQKLKGFFTQAIAALDAAKDTEEKYQTYYDRVQVESLFYRYMLLKNYKMEFSNEELNTMVDEFETYARIGNLTQFNNSGKNGAKQVESFIATLRSELG